MNFSTLSLAVTGMALCWASCTPAPDSPATETTDTLQTNQITEMQTFISIFEIPATDISRAITFYQNILNLPLEQMEVPGMQLAIFPYENQAVAGVIIQAEGYQPSADGVTIYLNGGPDLQVILSKVEVNGGKILLPKTPHADENGYFALFLDTEGNKLGLSSPN